MLTCTGRTRLSNPAAGGHFQMTSQMTYVAMWIPLVLLAAVGSDCRDDCTSECADLLQKQEQLFRGALEQTFIDIEVHLRTVKAVSEMKAAFEAHLRTAQQNNAEQPLMSGAASSDLPSFSVTDSTHAQRFMAFKIHVRAGMSESDVLELAWATAPEDDLSRVRAAGPSVIGSSGESIPKCELSTAEAVTLLRQESASSAGVAAFASDNMVIVPCDTPASGMQDRTWDALLVVMPVADRGMRGLTANAVVLDTSAARLALPLQDHARRRVALSQRNVATGEVFNLFLSVFPDTETVDKPPPAPYRSATHDLEALVHSSSTQNVLNPNLIPQDRRADLRNRFDGADAAASVLLDAMTATTYSEAMHHTTVLSQLLSRTTERQQFRALLLELQELHGIDMHRRCGRTLRWVQPKQ